MCVLGYVHVLGCIGCVCVVVCGEGAMLEVVLLPAWLVFVFTDTHHSTNTFLNLSSNYVLFKWWGDIDGLQDHRVP